MTPDEAREWLVVVMGDLVDADFATMVAKIRDAAKQTGGGTNAEKAARVIAWAEGPTGPGLYVVAMALPNSIKDKAKLKACRSALKPQTGAPNSRVAHVGGRVGGWGPSSDPGGSVTTPGSEDGPQPPSAARSHEEQHAGQARFDEAEFRRFDKESLRKAEESLRVLLGSWVTNQPVVSTMLRRIAEALSLDVDGVNDEAAILKICDYFKYNHKFQFFKHLNEIRGFCLAKREIENHETLGEILLGIAPACFGEESRRQLYKSVKIQSEVTAQLVKESVTVEFLMAWLDGRDAKFCRALHEGKPQGFFDLQVHKPPLGSSSTVEEARSLLAYVLKSKNIKISDKIKESSICTEKLDVLAAELESLGHGTGVTPYLTYESAKADREHYQKVFNDMIKALQKALGNETAPDIHRRPLLAIIEIGMGSTMEANERYIHVAVTQIIEAKIEKYY